MASRRRTITLSDAIKAFACKESTLHNPNYDLRHQQAYSNGKELWVAQRRIAWWNPDHSLSITYGGAPTQAGSTRLNLVVYLTFPYTGTPPFHIIKGRYYHLRTEISADSVVTYHPIDIGGPVWWREPQSTVDDLAHKVTMINFAMNLIKEGAWRYYLTK